MEYKKYAVEMDFTGITRKKAAEILGVYWSEQPVYQNQLDSYEIKDSLNRSWQIQKPQQEILCQKKDGDRTIGANFLYAAHLKTPLLYSYDLKKLCEAVGLLEEHGALTNESTHLCVQIEMRERTEQYQKNMENLMESKADMIYKAIQSNNPQPMKLTAFENRYLAQFPMFPGTFDSQQLTCAIQLSQAIHRQLLFQKRIFPRVSQSTNEKYTFRTWLLRIGMIGEEFKNTRAVLLESLEGNAAWRNLQIRQPPEQSCSIEETEEAIDNPENNFTEPENDMGLNL